MDASHNEAQPSEALMAADPLANLFPRVHDTFNNLTWPLYDASVIDDNIKERDDGHILSFLAGCNYTIRCFTFDIPAPLKASQRCIDTKSRNFLVYWGCELFTADPKEYDELIKGNQALLASFHTGVMYALKSLRDMEMPDDVQKDKITSLAEAFETQAHQQFASLVEYVAPIVQHQKLETMLKGFAGQEHKDDAETLHGDSSENEDDGQASRSGYPDDEAEAHNDEAGDDKITQHEDGDKGTSQDGYEGELAITLVEYNGEEDKGNEHDTEGEGQPENPDGQITEPKKLRNRAKSKKAKQAKKQQKKQQKKSKQMSNADKD